MIAVRVGPVVHGVLSINTLVIMLPGWNNVYRERHES